MSTIHYLFAATMLLQAGAVSADLDLGGDMRVRFETIEQEGKDTRYRWRLRARVTGSADVSDTVSAHLRLASGSDTPTSRNQTFGDGFSAKGFRLDRAYLQFMPEDSGATFQGGKMPVPFTKPGGSGDLVWDGDLNLEGLQAELSYDRFTIDAGFYPAEERSEANDTFLYAAQITAEVKAGVKAAVAYHVWDNIKGFAPLFDPADSFGNTTVADEDGALSYAQGFSVVDAMIEWETEMGALPVTVFGEYIINTDADVNDTGYMAGVKVGRAEEAGTWQGRVDYRDIEADATVGAFTDSDSFGGGGTNGKGIRVKAKYAMHKNWSAGITVYVQSIDPDGTDIDYERLQLDVMGKF